MFKIEDSNRKYKKKKVFINNEWIHFGDNRYEDFTTHHDEARRIRYIKRAINIKDSNGRLTAFNINSPNYWAMRILWGYKPTDNKYITKK